MTDITEFSKIIGGLILIIAYLISLRSNLLQYKKLRKEVNEIKIVVKDTKELRNALMKPIEGSWKVRGDFTKYKGILKKHYSTGEINFIWFPEKRHYDVSYVYSVREEKSEVDLITCFCRGTLSGDIGGNIKDKDIDVSLEIISRTSIRPEDNAISKHFELKNGVVATKSLGIPTQIEFTFSNSQTEGKIKIVK